jgi:ornithine--oxo-acid transaminase
MLDFVSGYGAVTLGHNSPTLLAGLIADIGSPMPNLHPLGISADAGELAAQLLELSGMSNSKVFFGNTGADAVEAALKFSFIHTGRSSVISITGGFHGLSLTSTWLAGAEFWRNGLPSMPDSFKQASFGDVNRIGDLLAGGDIAALLLEPVQGTAGARVWDRGDLIELSRLCRDCGTILIFDEVLSGLGRTGEWFAFQALGINPPDILLLSKGLTGGVLPASAVLMHDSIYQSVFARPGTAKIHGSTFGGNNLAMRCGLRTLKLLRGLKLPNRANELGHMLQNGINGLGSKYGFSCEGIGMTLSILAGRDALNNYGDQAANILWQSLLQQKVLTVPAAHDPNSLRLLPPLTVTPIEINTFISAYAQALNMMSSNGIEELQ